uniref:Uncharacterized protein n=1 Tax=Myoviridae sp. ct0Qb19 TaxID=2827653 RepID=A0A8S5SZP8_9CAUD|nr:MAG TPA: hypothetical protein [Myoviridae sp. ct0Qb19]
MTGAFLLFLGKKKRGKNWFFPLVSRPISGLIILN